MKKDITSILARSIWHCRSSASIQHSLKCEGRATCTVPDLLWGETCRSTCVLGIAVHVPVFNTAGSVKEELPALFQTCYEVKHAEVLVKGQGLSPGSLHAKSFQDRFVVVDFIPVFLPVLGIAVLVRCSLVLHKASENTPFFFFHTFSGPNCVSPTGNWVTFRFFNIHKPVYRCL